MKYRNRIADSILKDRLESKGAVLIEGPKWCGKTTTASQCAASVLDLADTKVLSESLEIADLQPSKLLEGATPRLIDEWQEIPSLWDQIRITVDRRHEVGQFILTGSAIPADKSNVHHTGTGRISRMVMRTMSLWESQESNGGVSLSELFNGLDSYVIENTKNLEEIAFMICRGGWPFAIDLKEKGALRQALDYHDAVVNYDITRVDEVRRSPIFTERLLKAYSRHIGYQTPISTLRSDLKTGDKEPDGSTIDSYLDALKRIFVIEEMTAWNPNLRSKTAIRTSNTRYFTDPSIGCAALGIGPNDLINDLKTMGMMFENLCIRDLRVYADALDGKVYHYRDANGLECDAVAHLRNGKYGLIEIKLGGEKQINEAAETLNKFSEKLDYSLMPRPSFKMILTAVGKFAYCRKDGIHVVPVTCLKN